jgi:hypothetical protein
MNITKKNTNEPDQLSPRQEAIKPRRIAETQDALDHRTYDIVYEDQRLRFLEAKFDKKALEAFRCPCLVCVCASHRRYLIAIINYNRLSKPLKYKNDSYVSRTNENNSQVTRKSKPVERDYVFIMRRLVPPARASRSLNINVPDTVCFMAGDPRLIMYS